MRAICSNTSSKLLLVCGLLLTRSFEIEQVGHPVASIGRPALYESQASLLQHGCPTIDDIVRKTVDLLLASGERDLPADNVLQDVEFIRGEFLELFGLLTGMLDLVEDGLLLFGCRLGFLESPEGEVDARSNLFFGVSVAQVRVGGSLDD